MREIEFVVASVPLATGYTPISVLGELTQQRFQPVVQFLLPSSDIDRSAGGSAVEYQPNYYW